MVSGLLHLPAWAADTTQSTFDLVLSGKSCKAGSTSAQTIHCDYKVGTGLHFSIDGVGDDDAGITFVRSSFDGDFYATFGVLHGCVIVKRGGDAREKGPLAGPGGPSDYAFVSPKNGKVYRTWVECKQAATFLP